MPLILAESVSIDGGVVAVLLAILLVLAAAAIALVAAGVVWARRAAHGSERAMAGFVVVASIEAVLAVLALANLGSFVTMVFALAFFVHVGVFAYERTKAGGGSPP